MNPPASCHCFCLPICRMNVVKNRKTDKMLKGKGKKRKTSKKEEQGQNRIRRKQKKSKEKQNE